MAIAVMGISVFNNRFDVKLFDRRDTALYISTFDSTEQDILTLPQYNTADAFSSSLVTFSIQDSVYPVPPPLGLGYGMPSLLLDLSLLSISPKIVLERD